jgi:hypothetical protein
LQGTAIQMEAMAHATSVDELFARLESEGVFLRIDPQVAPTMFRGAIVSESELHLLRRIDDVVRMGQAGGRLPESGRLRPLSRDSVT